MSPTWAAELRSPGRWLQMLGVAHVAVGAAIYREALGEIVDGNVVATIPDHGDKATAFWFLLGAPLMWTTGRLLRVAEAHDDLAAQRTVGTVVAGTALICCVANPISPFWVVAAVGAAAVRRSRVPAANAAT